MEQKKIIKSAIYTRKSSEEGLELDFNSLDAQREACESYIKSQKHEGWILVEKEYSDGGISGGTLERPALKELLQDIKDGLVDMIVVYKIDRLTRSLHDFSKLVEVFDKHNTSFVSITQQFNTSTSMGRLTLNMLLSFAQFEREVTGERIRDKKLATAKKGLWGSGGKTSFGYKAIPTNPEFPSGSKKLVPDKIEMPQLKRIFKLYLELGKHNARPMRVCTPHVVWVESVQELMYRLQDEGILTRNNKPFTSGNLYEILKRKIYIGKIEHKNQVYDGIHDPIIDVDIFNQAQELLSNNCNSHKRRYKAEQPSLLASKLYDDNDFIMSPSHAVKKGKRYRYYISQAYLKKRKELAGSLPQVPATELEQTSSDFIKKKLEELLKFENYRIEQYELYRQNLESYLESWSLQNKETHFIVRAIIHKIVISHINIIYYLNPKSLEDILNLTITKQEVINYEVKDITDNDCEIIILPCELKRVNQGKTLIVGNIQNHKNEEVIKLLKQAWKWSECIENNMTIKEISEIEKVSTNYIGKVLKLRFLSPKIQKMILLGEQSEKLTSHNLRLVTSTDFKEQERVLGI